MWVRMLLRRVIGGGLTTGSMAVASSSAPADAPGTTSSSLHLTALLGPDRRPFRVALVAAGRLGSR